ncbi:hypothetical protein ONA70_12460 [Micromonospora yasonensis]|uniref:hypothetical protein n=1 Tax=Micromonospora yasonensis TaxID=1128667 RepID=UPI00223298D7|nr:hypothetical protein [Micromonospora yasonensis]MCW3840911.1 hypothetical protein [Micromonospora yasonensis]
MTDPTRAALSRVAEFLAGLSDADVAALAKGRARLAVLPAAGAAPPDTEVDGGPAPGRTAAPDGADVERAHAALAAMARRDEGTAYLASWTSRELRALAARVGLRGVTGLRKTELVDRIVDRTIGFRLDSAAIRRR